jgi:aspartate dehydrogenase
MAGKKIGIIGCGTIGGQLATAIDNGTVKNATLSSLFDIIPENIQNLKHGLKSGPSTFSNFDDFINTDLDIVVEAASQEAVKKFAAKTLSAGKDIMIMSVGALADEMLFEELQRQGSKNGSRIYLPSGAIAGIDAIRAVRHLLKSVELTTTKNPKALAGAPFFKTNPIKLEEIKEPTIIYDGTAKDAVKAFPSNINVAAVLSIAGIGLESTRVRIVADPSFNTNQHEILARGSFGEFRFIVNNVPSPTNPKTSFLAVLSAIECLRSICEDGIRIGS